MCIRDRQIALLKNPNAIVSQNVTNLLHECHGRFEIVEHGDGGDYAGAPVSEFAMEAGGGEDFWN